MTLRIGTSGWNYPSGKGKWTGIFYPARRRQPKGFDELAFYAEHFNTVEVNSTFYGQPRADVCRAWAERTPRGFEFSVKLYQKFTHPTMFKNRLGTEVARNLRPPRDDRGTEVPSDLHPEMIAELARPNDADLDEFRRGIDPLPAAGKMGALLAQFPPSFKDTPESQDYLTNLLRRLKDYPVAVELRHRSWSDRMGETLRLLNAFSAAWVQIDEPKFRFSIRQNYLPNVKGFYYMRLHGRNVRN